MIFKTNQKEILLLFITYLLIFVRDMQIINIPFLCFSFLCIIASITLPLSLLYMYIICLVPFCRALPYSEMILIVLISTLVRRIIKDGKIKHPISYVLVLFLVAIELIGESIWGEFSNEIIYLAVYLIFISYYIGNRLYSTLESKVIKQYILSTILALGFVIFREINTLGLDYIMTYNVRFGANTNDIMVTNFNSNEMGLYAIIAISLSLVLYIYMKKIIYLFSAIGLSLLGIFSISRTFMVLLILVWLIFLVMSKLSLTKKIIILFLLFLISFVLFILFPEMIEWISGYFQERTLESGGRINLITLYFDKQFDSIYGFLFGYTSMYMNVLKTNIAVHNGLQEMLICWGIVGTVVALYWIYTMIKKVGLSNKKIQINNMYKWFPLIVFFIYIQAIQFFSQHNYIVVFLIALLSTVLEFEGDTNENRY